jgi:hypothetical protein
MKQATIKQLLTKKRVPGTIFKNSATFTSLTNAKREILELKTSLIKNIFIYQIYTNPFCAVVLDTGIYM